MTGISGSGISSSAAQTCVGGHHGAPGHRAPHLGHLVPERLELVRVPPRSTACAESTRSPTRRASSRPLLGLEHAERVRPQLLDRRAEARLVAQARRPHLRVHAVVDLLAVDLRREARELGVVRCLQRLDAAPGRPPRRDSGARSCAPTRAGAARRAARSGTRPARGRTRARRRRCRARAAASS